MTLRVSGKNLDIGEALRQHVLEKVETTVARYFTGSVGGHVVMTREGSGYRSDCTLRLSSGLSLHAEGRGRDDEFRSHLDQLDCVSVDPVHIIAGPTVIDANVATARPS